MPFLAEQDVVARLAGRHGLQDARVRRALAVLALAGDVLADLLDDAVAVEVVRRVLVERRRRCRRRPGTWPERALPPGPLHEVLAAVGVDRRERCRRRARRRAGDVGRSGRSSPSGTRSCRGRPRRPGSRCRGRWPRCTCRLARFGPGGGVVDGHEHDVAAVVALADRRVLEELREGLLEPLHVGLELRRVVPAVEVELDLERRSEPRRRRGRRWPRRWRLRWRRAAGRSRAPPPGRRARPETDRMAAGPRDLTCVIIASCPRSAYFSVTGRVAVPPFCATAFSGDRRPRACP